MSKLAASPSKTAAIGVPVVEKHPDGGVKFSIRLEGPREQVFLFAKKNDTLTLAKDGASGIHGTFEEHTDGTITYYHIEPASAYNPGDKIAARFYAFSPSTGQQRFPGPSDDDFTPPTFEYQPAAAPPAPSAKESTAPAAAKPATFLMSLLPGFMTGAPTPVSAVPIPQEPAAPAPTEPSTEVKKPKEDVKPVYSKAFPVTIPSSKGEQKVSLIPLNPDRFTTIQFLNNTQGKRKDDEIYATVICRDDRLAIKDKQGKRNPPGPLCYVLPDGTLKRIR